MFLPPDASYLALGGIAAACAAGWSQLRQGFSYISNLVIVSDSFDQTTTTCLHAHLRKHWTVIPGGPSVYRTETLQFKDGRTYRVPFRLPRHVVLYRQGWKILLAKGNDNLTLTYLRGTVKVPKMVSDSLDAVALQEENFAAAVTRFHVSEVIGKEKHYGLGGHDPMPTGSISGSTLTQNNSNYMESYLNTSIDKSFKYDSESWQYRKGEDPMSHLYFNEDIKVYIEQARRWLGMASWYAERMIPHRRGWMLEGPPGTGKSSLAKAIAQMLGIPIYRYHLNTLTDQEFIDNWNSMSAPCIALLEDFDGVFHGRIPTRENKSLSFDTVLNCISGVTTQPGIFLMLSTNDMSKIDPAMGVSVDGTGLSSRPGRIDTVIHVGNMERAQRYKMAHRILRDWPESIDEVVAIKSPQTPAQFMETCIQFALTRLQQEEDAATEAMNLMQDCM